MSVYRYKLYLITLTYLQIKKVITVLLCIGCRVGLCYRCVKSEFNDMRKTIKWRRSISLITK